MPQQDASDRPRDPQLPRRPRRVPVRGVGQSERSGAISWVLCRYDALLRRRGPGRSDRAPASDHRGAEQGTREALNRSAHLPERRDPDRPLATRRHRSDGGDQLRRRRGGRPSGRTRGQWHVWVDGDRRVHGSQAEDLFPATSRTARRRRWRSESASTRSGRG